MSDTLNDISAALQTFVVSPLNSFGLAGFVFDVVGEQTAHLSADITDHYTEDNRALQDHIAIRPKKITLRGYVGELTYGNANGASTLLQSVTQKLTVLSAFLPQVSAATDQAQQLLSDATSGTATLDSLTQAIGPAANIYSVVKNALGAVGPQSKQQNAFNYFQALMTEGVLLSIQTPWEFLTSMAIETIVAIQSEETTSVTDFAVTFKQIRIAATQTLAYIPKATGGTPSTSASSSGSIAPTMQFPASLQAAPEVKQGVVSGAALAFGALPGAQGLMKGVQDILIKPLLTIYQQQKNAIH